MYIGVVEIEKERQKVRHDWEKVSPKLKGFTDWEVLITHLEWIETWGRLGQKAGKETDRRICLNECVSTVVQVRKFLSTKTLK